LEDSSGKIDPALVDVVQRMFQRCFDKRTLPSSWYRVRNLAFGYFGKAITESNTAAEFLAYVLDASTTFV
jgi:hypothetical protein